SVAGGLNDPAAMLLDLGIGHLAPDRLEPRKRSLLVGAHEPAIARNIGGENGGPPALEAFRGQSRAPQPPGPEKTSALNHPSPKGELAQSFCRDRHLLVLSRGANTAAAMRALPKPPLETALH